MKLKWKVCFVTKSNIMIYILLPLHIIFPIPPAGIAPLNQFNQKQQYINPHVYIKIRENMIIIFIFYIFINNMVSNVVINFQEFK